MGKYSDMGGCTQRRRGWYPVAGVVFSALFLSACAGRIHMPGYVQPVEESSLSFQSQGHTVQVDAYLPEAKGRRRT